MEKCNLEKARTTQQMLENLVDKVNKLTSNNISCNIASLRSITTNLNTVMIQDLISSCEDKDLELKQLLEKIERNIWGIDSLLSHLTATTVENGKIHLSTWIEFYANALNTALLKYEA
jgi:hypothetical protein